MMIRVLETWIWSLSAFLLSTRAEWIEVGVYSTSGTLVLILIWCVLLSLNVDRLLMYRDPDVRWWAYGRFSRQKRKRANWIFRKLALENPAILSGVKRQHYNAHRFRTLSKRGGYECIKDSSWSSRSLRLGLGKCMPNGASQSCIWYCANRLKYFELIRLFSKKYYKILRCSFRLSVSRPLATWQYNMFQQTDDERNSGKTTRSWSRQGPECFI